MSEGVQFWTGKGTVLFKAIVRGTLWSTKPYSLGIWLSAKE